MSVEIADGMGQDEGRGGGFGFLSVVYFRTRSDSLSRQMLEPKGTDGHAGKVVASERDVLVFL